MGMLWRRISGLAVAFVVLASVGSVVEIVHGDSFSSISIESDGTVQPASAPIRWNNDRTWFTLTDDIFGSIRVYRDLCSIDGDGHTISGLRANLTSGITGFSRNVHIRNVVIKDHRLGIDLKDSHATSSVINCTFLDNYKGLSKESYQASGTLIVSNNTFDGNDIGIAAYGYGCVNSYYNNTIMNSMHWGIFDATNRESLISNNRIQHNDYGIHFGFGKIRGNDIHHNRVGVYYGREVHNNSIHDNNETGILLDEAGFPSVIANNTLRDNHNGIVIESRAYGSLVSNNHIENSTYAGITVRDGPDDNRISNNRINDNTIGLLLEQSTNTTVALNSIENNTIQVQQVNCGYNEWDNGQGRGNYWSDYHGLDNGANGRPAGDGVGDTEIPHPQSDVPSYQYLDRYPLMATIPVGQFDEAPVADAGPDQLCSFGDHVVLDGTGSHDNEDPISDLSFTWSLVSGPGTVSILDSDRPKASFTVFSEDPTPVHASTGTMSFEFRLRVRDSRGYSDDDRVLVTAVPDVNGTVFVSIEHGDDDNPGTPREPVVSSKRAFDLAQSSNPHKDVCYQEGTYASAEGTLTVMDGMSILGGFIVTHKEGELRWRRGYEFTLDTNFDAFLVNGTTIEGAPIAMRAVYIQTGTRLDGLTVRSADAPDGDLSIKNGGNSIGLLCLKCSDQLLITHDRLEAGMGGDGLNGRNGLPGDDGDDGTDADGAAGGDAGVMSTDRNIMNGGDGGDGGLNLEGEGNEIIKGIMNLLNNDAVRFFMQYILPFLGGANKYAMYMFFALASIALFVTDSNTGVFDGGDGGDATYMGGGDGGDSKAQVMGLTIPDLFTKLAGLDLLDISVDDIVEAIAWTRKLIKDGVPNVAESDIFPYEIAGEDGTDASGSVGGYDGDDGMGGSDTHVLPLPLQGIIRVGEEGDAGDPGTNGWGGSGGGGGGGHFAMYDCNLSNIFMYMITAKITALIGYLDKLNDAVDKVNDFINGILPSFLEVDLPEINVTPLKDLVLDFDMPTWVPVLIPGGGGGGGGAGGAAGNGAEGGGYGGASFALFLHDSSPFLWNLSFSTAGGGRGGDGGIGGQGGVGGLGGNGTDVGVQLYPKVVVESGVLEAFQDSIADADIKKTAENLLDFFMPVNPFNVKDALEGEWEDLFPGVGTTDVAIGPPGDGGDGSDGGDAGDGGDGGGGTGGHSCGIYHYGRCMPPAIGFLFFGQPSITVIPGCMTVQTGAGTNIGPNGIPGNSGRLSGKAGQGCRGNICPTMLTAIPPETDPEDDPIPPWVPDPEIPPPLIPIEEGEERDFPFKLPGTLGGMVNDVVMLNVEAAWSTGTVGVSLVTPSGFVLATNIDAGGSGTRGPGDRSGPNKVNRIVAPQRVVYSVTDPDEGEWTLRLFGVDVGPQGETVQLTLLTYVNNEMPTASFTGPATAGEGAMVEFDAAASTDPDGDRLYYRWDFDMDGVWDTYWSTSPLAEHSWSDDYEGQVTLEVLDGRVSNVTTRPIEVVNSPPTVETLAIGMALVGQPVELGIAYSDDGLADTHSISWDFGDGTPPMGTDRLWVVHTFAVEGLHTVSVSVTDDDGDTTTASLPVEVKRPERPVPAPNEGVSVATSVTAYSGTDSTIDIFNRTFAEENGLQFRWDLDNDGVWDTELSDDPVLIHAFEPGESGTVAVQVVGDGISFIYLVAVDIADIEEARPVAIAGGPYIGLTGEEIVFDGSDSSYPVMGDLEYRWDYNDDGKWDTEFSSSPIWTYTYRQAYEGAVVLEVRVGSLSAVDRADVVILEGGPGEPERVEVEKRTPDPVQTVIIGILVGVIVLLMIIILSMSGLLSGKGGREDRRSEEEQRRPVPTEPGQEMQLEVEATKDDDGTGTG